MDRAERLDYGSLMTRHGVRGREPGRRGKAHALGENSWGRTTATFDSITDAWFDEYVYQVVVDKQYLTENARHVRDRGGHAAQPCIRACSPRGHGRLADNRPV